MVRRTGRRGSTSRANPSSNARMTRLDSAMQGLTNVRQELRNHRSKIKREFLPAMLVTFLIASSITAFTVNVNSWMTPLSSQPWFLDLWREDNIAVVWSNSILIIGCSMTALTYITDMRDWKACCKCVYYPWSVSIAVAALFWSSLVNRPITCLGLSIVMTVAATLSVRNRIFKGTPKKYLAYGECLAYSLLAVILLVAWLVWYTNGGDSNLDGVDDWEDGSVVRTFAPVVQAAAFLLVAWFAWIRSRWHVSSLANNMEVDLGPEFMTAIIILGSILGFAFIAVWIGVNDPQVSNFILQISMMTFACVAVYILNWIGIKRLKKAAEESDFLSTLVNILSSDWVKAIVVIFLGWILPVVLIIEGLHQIVRHRLQACGLLDQRDDEDDDDAVFERSGSRWITVESWERLEQILEWNWTSIFSKGIWLGLIVFFVQVVITKAMTLFLSWFNERMRTWPMAGTIALLFVVEMALFLFPPIAGMVLYLTAGLVLIPKFMNEPTPENPRDRWILGMIVTTLFCWVLKIFAVYVEQKGFGGYFKTNVPVKKFIGVHTNFMKAVRYILSERGMILPKISILVGGPDWPTSVITGILGLPAIPMLLGTLPVIVIIAPTVVSSGFLLCPPEVFSQEERPFCAAIDKTLLLFAAIVQQATTFVALYYTGVLLEHMRSTGELTPEWMKDPQEDEILALVELDNLRNADFQEKSQWKNLTGYVKVSLAFGTFLSAMIFAINFLAAPYKPFDLQNTIADRLDGNILNIVNPIGWVQITAAFVAIACIRNFQNWVGANCDAFEEEGGSGKGDIEMSAGKVEEQPVPQAKPAEPNAPGFNILAMVSDAGKDAGKAPLLGSRSSLTKPASQEAVKKQATAEAASTQGEAPVAKAAEAAGEDKKQAEAPKAGSRPSLQSAGAQQAPRGSRTSLQPAGEEEAVVKQNTVEQTLSSAMEASS